MDGSVRRTTALIVALDQFHDDRGDAPAFFQSVNLCDVGMIE
jgi:hypothetical protein